MEKRFFVTIVSTKKQKVRFLKHYDYDLFREALKSKKDKEFTIEGMLTLAQIERLVEDGYKVMINEEASTRARGRPQVIDFKTWLSEMEE
jgi:hypothetical protein